MKKSDFNIIKFLVIFIVLLQGFYLYVGITTSGGKLFFPALAKYLNIPQWLTLVVSKSSKILLELCGYSVYENGEANLTITGSRGVTIAWGCLGAGAMSLWIAFIIAHRSAVKYKLKWIFVGLILIFITNILRIMMIVLSNHYAWSNFIKLNAHTSFNLLTYTIILLLMLIFVRNYNKQNKQLKKLV